MKFAAAAILIVAASAEEKKVVDPLIEASVKDTVNDCLFLDNTNEGAMRKLNEDGTPSTCWGMYFNLCDSLYVQPTKSCQIMTYGNSSLEWLSSTISVNYWPYRNQSLPRAEYDAKQIVL